MSKLAQSAATLGEFAERLTAVAKRVAVLQKRLKALSLETIRLDFEASKDKGMAAIEVWIGEAEIEMDACEKRMKTPTK